MRRGLMLIAVLLCVLHMLGQTTTYTGTVKDLTGAAVTSGRITWSLNILNGGSIPGTGSFAGSTISCLISATGHPVSAVDGTSACTVTNNTALTPAGTSYMMCTQPYYVSPGSCIITFAKGGTVDISTTVPTPATEPTYGVTSSAAPNTWGTAQTFTGGLFSTPYSSSPSNLNTAATAQNVQNVAPISIKEFGAVGDWSTDDTAALNAGLAYALAHNACLYFPAGGYKITSELQWTSPQRLCMRGESALTSYIGYLGSETVDSAFYLGANSIPVIFDLRNIGFAANANAHYAFHAIYAGAGTTMDTVAFAGGSISAFQGDFFNAEGDIRNLMVQQLTGFGPTGIPRCVNGLSFYQATVSGITYGSSQFTLTSPIVEYCTGIGLNFSHAFEVTVNGGQIAANRQQLYSNGQFNVFNGVLIENCINCTPTSVPSQIFDTWSQFNGFTQSDLSGTPVLTNIYGSHNTFNNSQLRANVESGANFNDFSHSSLLVGSIDAGFGTTGRDNSLGGALVVGFNKESPSDTNALPTSSCGLAPVRTAFSLSNKPSGTYPIMPALKIGSRGTWRAYIYGQIVPSGNTNGSQVYEINSAYPTITLADGSTLTFSNDLSGGNFKVAVTTPIGVVFYGWIEVYPGGYCGNGLAQNAMQFASPIIAGGIVDKGLATAGLVANDSAGVLMTTTALPNGTTATTQILSDNANKVATDAFVHGNISITTGTPTAGHAACIKSAGPPVVIGSCSTAIDSGGTCTCN